MSNFVSMARLLAVGTAILAAWVYLTGVAAQTAGFPPDFSSNGVGWRGTFGDNFTSIPGSPPFFTQDPAHPYIPNFEARRLGVQPTDRIADLSNRNLKQWAKNVMKKDNDEVLTGKFAYTPRTSCKPAGVPDFILFSSTLRILQTPEKVVMIMSGNSEVRHIYLNVAHSANPKPSWYGESVGYYEGDTLVVDTIGQNTNTFIDKFRTPHSEKLHVVERWRMINGGERMEVHITIEDPDTFYEPWQVTRNYNRTQATITEDICAEGNLILFDYGVPVDETLDF